MNALLEQPEIREHVTRWTVEQYQKFTEYSIFPSNVELIEGVIITKMPKSPKHRFATEKLRELLNTIFGNLFFISEEKPLTLKRSSPEPDVAVIKGSKEDYRTAHPQTARLVAEICYSSYALDFEKQFIYADAGIAEYWLVNLDKNEIEVYRRPENGQYHERIIYSKNQAIPIENTELILSVLFD